VLFQLVLFFFTFFWSYFYYSISPSFWIGGEWPPAGIEPIDPYSIPLLNTALLISSGIYVTYSHRLLKKIFIPYNMYGDTIADQIMRPVIWPATHVRLTHINWRNTRIICGLLGAISAGFIFLLLQLYEYNFADFCINDSVYGSIFYLLTGFHGFHVFIGIIFLSVTLIRTYYGHFNVYKECHLGFEFSLWYWHFVDVVWLLLFVIVYF